MKLKVAPDGKECVFRTREEIQLEPRDDHYELLVRVIDEGDNFPRVEKLLILAAGTEKSMRKMRDIINRRDGIRSHEEYLEIRKSVT